MHDGRTGGEISLADGDGVVPGDCSDGDSDGLMIVSFGVAGMGLVAGAGEGPVERAGAHVGDDARDGAGADGEDIPVPLGLK